jgi:hypothetical protein
VIDRLWELSFEAEERFIELEVDRIPRGASVYERGYVGLAYGIPIARKTYLLHELEYPIGVRRHP